MSTPLPQSLKKNFKSPEGQRWTSGFFLLGVLISLISSLLVMWHAHIDTDPQLVGLHFLSFDAGYVIAAAATQQLVSRLSVRTLAVAASVIAVASLVELLVAAPPAPPLLRMLGLGGLGYSAGTLLTTLLFALEGCFLADPLALTDRAGRFFGCGAIVATGIVAASYFAGAQLGVALVAIVPAVFLIIFGTSAPPLAPARRFIEGKENRLADYPFHRHSLGAALFSFLMFLQSGNEWAVAGWLPLFLIRRLGANPALSISTLGMYFLVLTFGRFLAHKLLIGITQRKLLIMAATTATAGCLMLTFSASLATALIAVIVIAAGFAPIYPVIAETLDCRFCYRPRFYNRLFSIAITGAMTAPWLLGYVDSGFGIGAVMVVPAIGSIAVLLCTLLFMFEARVMGAKPLSPQPELAAAAKR